VSKRRIIKKKHRPIVAALCILSCVGFLFLSFKGYQVGSTSEFNGAAMLGHMMCFVWFLVAVICFELAFEFHIGRRQVSKKRNHPVLAIGAAGFAIGSIRLAYEVAMRALESRHVDLAFGFYLASLWFVLAIAFLAIAFEFQSRRASK
jgi:NADH:ubiquinone oxidoreductase subunit 3 (subunit A)